MAVDGGIVAQDVPEPALAFRDGEALGALVGLALHRGKEGIARIVGPKLVELYVLGSILCFREDDLGALSALAHQHAGAVIAQKQDAGQGEGRNVLKTRPVENAAGEPGLAGNTQAGLRGDMTAVEACHEKLRRDNDTLETKQQGHAAQDAWHEVHIGRTQGFCDKLTGRHGAIGLAAGLVGLAQHGSRRAVQSMGPCFCTPLCVPGLRSRASPTCLRRG